MPANLTPEEIDVLLKLLDEMADGGALNIYAVSRDTIAALRAAPVAMRERAARWHDLQSDAAMGNLSSDSAGHDYRHAHKTADFHKTCADAIRALPLDAPAPVDPVAEFERLMADAMRLLRFIPAHLRISAARALAQETRHD